MTAPNLVCPRCDGLGMVATSSPFDPYVQCPVCSGRGYLDAPAGTVTFSDIATTPQARARLRRETRGRQGRALSTTGQQNLIYKQRRRGR